jgi:hypothetical protein
LNLPWRAVKMGVRVGTAPVSMGAPYLARQTALSSPYQQFMSQPSYGTMTPDLMANIARFAAMNEGRQSP